MAVETGVDCPKKQYISKAGWSRQKAKLENRRYEVSPSPQGPGYRQESVSDQRISSAPNEDFQLFCV